MPTCNEVLIVVIEHSVTHISNFLVTFFINWQLYSLLYILHITVTPTVCALDTDTFHGASLDLHEPNTNPNFNLNPKTWP